MSFMIKCKNAFFFKLSTAQLIINIFVCMLFLIIIIMIPVRLGIGIACTISYVKITCLHTKNYASKIINRLYYYRCIILIIDTNAIYKRKHGFFLSFIDINT